MNALDTTTETYVYTTDGYLADVTINGTLRSRRTNDALGRVTSYSEYGNYTRNTVYDKDNRITSETGTDGTTTYTYGSNGGDLAQITNVNTINGSTTTTNTYFGYQYWDEAKQATITTQAYNPALAGNNSLWKPGYSDLKYDINGHLTSAVDRVGNRSFSYTNDAQGRILVRQEQAGSSVNKLHRYYYIDGQRVGDIGNDGSNPTDYLSAIAKHQDQLNSQHQSRTGNDDKYVGFKPIISADSDQNYEPISPTTASVAGDYTVKAGDTLQSIANAVWGDASMWYLIADANGLSASQSLAAGINLVIPFLSFKLL
ncbi:MAG TPA: LysM peptidoglycan-binding domain-containing protein [Methylotenera sp.]|nr:LysM peptidoglycan-binding domain-containing protein [Methylotenera sp.]